MSRYLLDTHVWLWVQSDPDRLGRRSRAIIDDPGSSLLLSVASAWEIAIKHELGKLALPEAPESYVPDRCRRSGTTSIPIEMSHTLRAGALPPVHRDPFDRVIVAQAQALRIPVLTVDEAIMAYDVESIVD